MSKGKSRQSSSNQSSSEQHLDPDVKNALLGNAAAAQAKFGNMQYTPLTGDMVSKWQNPFTQQVIDTSLADMDHTRQQTIQQGHATAVGQSAFGGSRTGVLDALTNRDFADKAASMEAALRSQGYGQALQTAQTENQQQNQWPLLIQQLLNGTYGLMGNPTLGTSAGTGKSSGWSFQMSAPTGGGGGDPSAAMAA